MNYHSILYVIVTKLFQHYYIPLLLLFLFASLVLLLMHIPPLYSFALLNEYESLTTTDFFVSYICPPFPQFLFLSILFARIPSILYLLSLSYIAIFKLEGVIESGFFCLLFVLLNLLSLLSFLADLPV